jgi:hypothetical protein
VYFDENSFAHLASAHLQLEVCKNFQLLETIKCKRSGKKSGKQLIKVKNRAKLTKLDLGNQFRRNNTELSTGKSCKEVQLSGHLKLKNTQQSTHFYQNVLAFLAAHLRWPAQPSPAVSEAY